MPSEKGDHNLLWVKENQVNQDKGNRKSKEHVWETMKDWLEPRAQEEIRLQRQIRAKLPIKGFKSG